MSEQAPAPNVTPFSVERPPVPAAPAPTKTIFVEPIGSAGVDTPTPPPTPPPAPEPPPAPIPAIQPSTLPAAALPLRYALLHIGGSVTTLMARKQTTPERVSKETGVDIEKIYAIMTGRESDVGVATLSVLATHLGANFTPTLNIA